MVKLYLIVQYKVYNTVLLLIHIYFRLGVLSDCHLNLGSKFCNYRTTNENIFVNGILLTFKSMNVV